MSACVQLVAVAAGVTAVATEWRGFDVSQLANDDDNGQHPPFRTSPNAPREDALRMLVRPKACHSLTHAMLLTCSSLGPGATHLECECGMTLALMDEWGAIEPAACTQRYRACLLWPAAVDQPVSKYACCGTHVRASAHWMRLGCMYRDWWADPGHQFKPVAWKKLSFEELVSAVHNFTYSVVRQLVEQGTPPAAVQIGNEITNGLLWNNASSGESCADGGRLWCGKNSAAGWHRLGAIIKSGADAVRAACPSAAVAIHTDLGNHIAADGIDWVISWYRSLESAMAPASFDRIGLSMYPKYDKGTTNASLAKLGALAAAFPQCAIYIAETAYPADGETQPEAAFPASPAGQLAFLRAVRTWLVAAVPTKQNGGVLWWEGGENGWDSLWNTNYVARPALLGGFSPLH